MSLNSDIRDQAYQFFIEEAQELLQVIEEGLLNLKDDRSTPRIHSLMRAAHSIKGGAASVELDAIKTLAHRLEDFFKALYSDSVEFNSDLESLLLEAFDCLKNPLTEQMETGSFDTDNALLFADPVFSQLEILLGDALKDGDITYIPSSTDLGIDIVSSIFDVDVAQGIERLQQVIANPQDYEIVGELRAQAEVFAGFAELLSLPGFGAIASTVMMGTETHPEKALEIAQLMLADCSEARDLVLAGDRASGGSPSDALLAICESGGSGSIDTEIPATFNDFDDVFGGELGFSETETPEFSSSFPGAELELQEFTESDIFGSDLNNLEIEASQNIEEIDIVFDTNVTFIQNESINFQTSENESTFTDTPELDDIFGSEIDSEATMLETEIPDLDIFDTSITTIQNELIVDRSEQVEQVTISEENTSEVDEIVDTQCIDRTTIQASTPSSAPDKSQKPDPFSEEALAAAEAEILENAFAFDDSSLDDVFGEDIEDIQTSIVNSSKNFNSKNEEKEIEAANLAHADRVSNNIEQALQSIEQDFSQLPSLEDTPSLTPEPAKAEIVTTETPTKIFAESTNEREKQTTTPSTNKETAAANLSVRVDLSRLERMNNLIGELVINRNSLSLQNDQLQGNVKQLLTKFSRFREMTGKMREISDKMVVEVKSSRIDRSQVALKTQEESITSDSNFDSLEMDSYSSIHNLLQDVLEEMVQLEEAIDDITLFAKQSNLTIEQQRQMVAQMRDELMWARMLPLSQVLQRFPRTLRDLSTKYSKPVELKMIGVGVLVDKAILEKLYDPLLHLLRNAFDHGIESVDARRQIGKPEKGEIEIQAYYQGNQTIIEIRDDGQGLNLNKIQNKAIQNGLISTAQAASVSEDRLLDFIFEPGFSTAKKVSEISGRGVGLDIVRSQIQAMKGTVTVNSLPGRGTTFTLRLPLTLTIAKILVCSIESGAVAFPSDSIEEIIIPEKNQLKVSGKQRFLYWSDRLIPIHPLTELLKYNCTYTVDTSSKAFETLPVPEDWELPILLMRQGQQLVALEVERLITEQELVVKPFSVTLSAPKYSYGCTILGDGTLIPVVNGAVLIEECLDTNRDRKTITNSLPKAIEPNETEEIEEISDTEITAKSAAKTIQAPTILVVDDSAALRRTLALSLEKNGYQILQAKDGREALEQMHKHLSQIDLVICDVEMPNMNGFEFLGMRRKETALSKIPVAMLTSRGSEKHRALAKQLGANEYFTKPYIEQEFLREIKKLVRVK
jgi:two-component system, chemotaxis family, sensor histidine kinase and response regulator PixL